MAVDAHSGVNLIPVVTLLAAGVLAVPLFKRIGLDSVLGYMFAGLVIGPMGLGLISDPQMMLHVAELGVVLFLFVIGLEMQPSRLWALRRAILGLGVLQVAFCSGLLTLGGMLLGYPPLVAFIFGMGFVLTSTAIVFQVLNERGELNMEKGQRMVSILLLEDLAIVPLLAFVAFMSPVTTPDAANDGLRTSMALGVLAVMVVIGKYLLNPLFRSLAQANAREVMSAAALLVVLGAALIMQQIGLSMELGAFMAGVLLSESAFRHQLEADVEPFRGILLGLFFLSVGMSLDVPVIIAHIGLISLAVIIFMGLKGLGIYLVARLLKTGREEAVQRAALMAQGGEFAFVLFAAATSARIIDGATNAVFTSAVILSMVLTPFLVKLIQHIPGYKQEPSMDGIESPQGLMDEVLIIGFGRFGHMASQALLARGIQISIIDTDVEMIRVAASFGYKVYYGDGTRLDILHAAGAQEAKIVMICVDRPEVAKRIASLVKKEFPLTPIMVRAYDRRSSLALMQVGVDYQIRETLESAFVFSREALQRLGVTPHDAEEIVREVRARDVKLLERQLAQGLKPLRRTGNKAERLLFTENIRPAPLTPPQKAGTAGNEEAARLLQESEGSADESRRS